MTVCILGRQPKIGLAELECRFGSDAVTPVGEAAALVPHNFELRQFGGTVKAAALLATVDTADFDQILKKCQQLLPGLVADMPGGKVKLGLSLYGMNVSAQRTGAAGLTLKKSCKRLGRSVRVVPNNSPALTSAQVLHNQLLSDTGIELVVLAHGKQTLIARTTDEQNIADYTVRDRERPRRDARVGMLPPKLAQIMLNLAHGKTNTATTRVLDPFCGTGVVLQEAALQGFTVYGTDIDERMIRYSRDNLNWLQDTYAIPVDWYLEIADATEHVWRQPVDAVVCETYLGQPLSGLPKPEKLQEIIHTCNVIHRKFLQNIGQQLAPGTPLCLAVPAWRTGKTFTHLPVLRELADLGFERRTLAHAAAADLIYHREDQIVARELLILTKK